MGLASKGSLSHLPSEVDQGGVDQQVATVTLGFRGLGVQGLYEFRGLGYLGFGGWGSGLIGSKGF